MSLLDELVASAKQDREMMRTIIDLLRSGAMVLKSRETTGTGWKDERDEMIESYERRIAELDELISRHKT